MKIEFLDVTRRLKRKLRRSHGMVLFYLVRGLYDTGQETCATPTQMRRTVLLLLAVNGERVV